MFTDGYATDIHDKQACIGQDYETNSIKVTDFMVNDL